MKSDCYVYALLDPRKPGTYKYRALGQVWTFEYEPFYIGKGTKNRISCHNNQEMSNPHKTRKIVSIEGAGLKFLRQKIETGLSEGDAFYLEEALIKKIGRHNQKEGPLTNITKGGEGTSGYKVKSSTIKKRAKTNASKSEKEKAEISAKRSDSLVRVHAQKTPEEKERTARKISKATKAYMNNLSSAAIQARARKGKNTLEKKSSLSKQITHIKMSRSQTKRHASLSSAEKLKIADKKRKAMSRTLRHRTSQDRVQISRNISAASTRAHAQMSDETKRLRSEAISKKIKEAWAQKKALGLSYR